MGEEKIFSQKNATPLNKYLDSRFWNPSFLPEGEVVGGRRFYTKKMPDIDPIFLPRFWHSFLPSEERSFSQIYIKNLPKS